MFALYNTTRTNLANTQTITLEAVWKWHCVFCEVWSDSDAPTIVQPRCGTLERTGCRYRTKGADRGYTDPKVQWNYPTKSNLFYLLHRQRFMQFREFLLLLQMCCWNIPLLIVLELRIFWCFFLNRYYLYVSHMKINTKLNF